MPDGAGWLRQRAVLFVPVGGEVDRPDHKQWCGHHQDEPRPLGKQEDSHHEDRNQQHQGRAAPCRRKHRDHDQQGFEPLA